MNSPESINSEQQESSFFSTEDINAWRDEQKAKYNETDYPDEEMRELILLGIDQKAEAMIKERQAELGRYESQWAKLEDPDEYNKTGSDRMEEYETGLHSKTGRQRTVTSSGTYTPFDLYPRQKIVDENGEERFEYAEEQGATIRFANDIAIWTEIIPKSELRMDHLTSAEGNKLYYDFISGLMEKLPREKGEKLSDYENRVKEYVDSNWDSLLQKEYLKAEKSLEVSSRLSPSYKNEEEKNLEEKYKRIVEDGDGLQLVDDMVRIHDKINKAKDDGVIKPWLAERLKERGEAAKLALRNHLEPEVRQWRDEEMENYGRIANAKGMTSEQIEAMNQMIAERAKEKQALYEQEQARGTEPLELTPEEPGTVPTPEPEPLELTPEKPGKVPTPEPATIKEQNPTDDDKEKEELAKQLANGFFEKKGELKDDDGENRRLAEQLADRLFKEPEKATIEKNRRLGHRILSLFAPLRWLANRSNKKQAENQPVEVESPDDNEEDYVILSYDEGREEPDTSREAETTEEKKPTQKELDMEEYRFWKSIGEEGIEILKHTGELDDETKERAKKWWDALDEETQENVKKHAMYIVDNELAEFLGFKVFIFNKGMPSEDRERELRARSSRWLSIGEKGVEYMNIKDEEEFNAQRDEILSWWDNLSFSIQQFISQRPESKVLYDMISREKAQP